MTVISVSPWWKGKDHRRIRGSRGARFVSLKFHYVFVFSVVAFIQYVLRGHDDVAYHLPEPPVPAPPPLQRSLGYSLSREMPYWAAIETEESLPSHVPHRPVIDFHSVNPIALRGNTQEGK